VEKEKTINIPLESILWSSFRVACADGVGGRGDGLGFGVDGG
jgi:hypothetical protein